MVWHSSICSTSTAPARRRASCCAPVRRACATPIFFGGSNVAAGMDGGKVAATMDRLAGNLAKANALHTAGFPADIAYGAHYLASDDSRFVTGQDLTMDGGMTAGGRTNFEDLKSP